MRTWREVRNFAWHRLHSPGSNPVDCPLFRDPFTLQSIYLIQVSFVLKVEYWTNLPRSFAAPALIAINNLRGLAADNSANRYWIIFV